MDIDITAALKILFERAEKWEAKAAKAGNHDDKFVCNSIAHELREIYGEINNQRVRAAIPHISLPSGSKNFVDSQRENR